MASNMEMRYLRARLAKSLSRMFIMLNVEENKDRIRMAGESKNYYFVASADEAIFRHIWGETRNVMLNAYNRGYKKGYTKGLVDGAIISREVGEDDEGEE